MSTEIRCEKQLDESCLDKNNYLMTLLEAALRHQLISRQEVMQIQAQLIQLLDLEIARYTRYESTSVKVEKAEELMGSMLYNIDERLLREKDIEACLKLIRKSALADIFREGVELVRKRTMNAKVLYEKVKETKLPIQQLAYVDTIESFKDFFPFYEVEFSAQNANNMSIDYPLAHDKMDEQGVRYVESYLKKLYLENIFCQHFDCNDIEALLESSYENANEQLVNLFEMVLFEAIGGSLLGEIRINLTEVDCNNLFAMILEKEKLDARLDLAIETLFETLDLSDDLKDYCLLSCNMLRLNLSKIKESMSLRQVFVPIKSKTEERFYLDINQGMSDDAFRAVVDELLMSDFEGQLKTLRTKCQSIKDLVDLFETDCLRNEIYLAYYSGLSQMELAMLLSYLQITTKERLQEVIETKAFHHTWDEQLLQYVARLKETRQIFEIAKQTVIK